MAYTDTVPLTAFKGIGLYPEFVVYDADGTARDITNDVITFRILDAYDVALATLDTDDSTEIEKTNSEGGNLRVKVTPTVLTDITAGTTATFILYSVIDGETTFLGRNRFTLLPDPTA